MAPRFIPVGIGDRLRPERSIQRTQQDDERQPLGYHAGQNFAVPDGAGINRLPTGARTERLLAHLVLRGRPLKVAREWFPRLNEARTKAGN
jgi:hypothetical protein